MVTGIWPVLFLLSRASLAERMITQSDKTVWADCASLGGVCTYQKDHWWASDEGHCCREFAHVAPAVASSCFVSIFYEAQLADAPLSHLAKTHDVFFLCFWSTFNIIMQLPAPGGSLAFSKTSTMYTCRTQKDKGKKPKGYQKEW